MNGNSVLADSNIILYLLSGDSLLAQYLQPRFIYLSIISEIEILGFQRLTIKEEQKIRKLLASFRIIGLDETVKEETIRLRKDFRLKLPDCMIAATALSLDLPMLTADKQFRIIPGLMLEIYQPS